MIIRKTLTDSVDVVFEFVKSVDDIATGTANMYGWVLDDSYCVVGDGDEIDRDLIDFIQPSVYEEMQEEACNDAR